jgi:hypothetical protein
MPFYTPPNIVVVKTSFVAAQIGVGGPVSEPSNNLIPISAFALYNNNGQTGFTNVGEFIALYGRDSGNSYFFASTPMGIGAGNSCRILLNTVAADYNIGNPLNEGLEMYGMAITGTLGTLDIYLVCVDIGG